MRTVLLALTALAILLTGCGNEQVTGSAGGPRPTGEPLVGQAIEIGETTYFLGDTVVYENIAVVPLISQDYDPDQEADYVTLAEAIKNDWIEIIEKPGYAAVSELTVRYSGPKPLLLLAGELLLGGKQDRVVAKDTVIDSQSTVVVSVFCVEPGRWSGTSSSFAYSGFQVPMSVKEEVMTTANQAGVWDATRRYNRSSGASAGRSTVDMGMKSGEVVKFTNEGKDKLLALLESDSAIVGVVFIINGKIRSLEIFSAPRLFSSAYESILGGVLAEAAISPSDNADLPSVGALQAFLERVSSTQELAMAEGVPLDNSLNLSSLRRASVGGSIITGSADEAPITHGTFYNNED